MKRLGSLALGLLLLLGVLVGRTLLPDAERRSAPIATEGALGSRVDTGGFAVEVHKVRASRTLTWEDADKPAKTDGLWLVLDTTIVGEWKPTRFDDARLETPDGRVYHASERIDPDVILTQDDSNGPGIPRRGSIVFEVPESAVTGTTLRLGRALAEDTRLGPEAAVDLGLSATRSRALVDGAPAKIALTPPEFGR